MPDARASKTTRVYFGKQTACAKAYLSGSLYIFARLPLPTRFLYFKNTWGLEGYALEQGGVLSDAAYDLLCYKIPAGPADAQGRHACWANHVRDVLATWPGVCIYEVFTTSQRTTLAALLVLVKYALRSPFPPLPPHQNSSLLHHRYACNDRDEVVAAIEISSLCANIKHYGTWCIDFAKYLLFADEDVSTHGYLFAQTADKAQSFWEGVPFDQITEARTLLFQCVNLLPKDVDGKLLYGYEDKCSVRGRRIERVDVLPRKAGEKAKHTP